MNLWIEQAADAGPARPPIATEGYALAGGIAAIAVVLIAVGLVLGLLRRLLWLAKVAAALGALTLVVAVATAAILIAAF